MATQPPPQLPLFYKNLVPLQTGPHANFRQQLSDKAPFFAQTHAVPLTIDEFVIAQRNYPIIFSAGENSVPLALFGLNEGVNVFVQEDGSVDRELYVPAYVRRYPFLLARLQPDAQELSLCFDPDSNLVAEGGDGPALFDGEKPSEATNAILKFCEEFEMSAQRTGAFMKELQDMDLIMDGEVSIQTPNSQTPYVYRGFRMINEEKFRALDAETLHKIHGNGILQLLTAHLFSMSHMPNVFARQLDQGKVPQPEQGVTFGNA